MKLKLNKEEYQSPTISDIDMVVWAQDCAIAAESLKDAGFECQELFEVVDNIALAGNIINAYGGKWFVEHCDPTNQLCNLLGCATEALSAKKIDASMEGIISNLCETIAKYIRKFINWIAQLFKNGSTSSVNTAKLNKAASDAAEVAKEAPNANVANAPVPVITVEVTESLAKEIQDSIVANSAMAKNIETASVPAQPADTGDNEAKPKVSLPVPPPIKLANYSELRVRIKKVGDDASANANGVAGHMLGMEGLSKVHGTLAGSVKTLQGDSAVCFKTTYTVFNSIGKKNENIQIAFNNLRTAIRSENEFSKKFNDNIASVIDECKKLPLVPNRNSVVTAGQIGIRTPKDLSQWMFICKQIVALQGTGENLSDSISNGIKKLENDIVTPFKTDSSPSAVTVLKFATRSINLANRVIGTFRFVSMFATECVRFADSVTKSVEGHVKNAERDLNSGKTSQSGSSKGEEPARMAARF